MFDSSTMGIRDRRNAPQGRRPARFYACVEPLEARALLTADGPYWCGVWSVTVSPPGGQSEQGTLSFVAIALEPQGWPSMLNVLQYSNGMGGVVSYYLDIPPHTEDPGLATIIGQLSTSDGGAFFGAFSLTANPNGDPANTPDSFTGTITPDASQPPILVSGTFKAPPGNPSLTSAEVLDGQTVDRARPIVPTPTPTPPTPTPPTPTPPTPTPPTPTPPTPTPLTQSEIIADVKNATKAIEALTNQVKHPLGSVKVTTTELKNVINAAKHGNEQALAKLSRLVATDSSTESTLQEKLSAWKQAGEDYLVIASQLAAEAGDDPSAAEEDAFKEFATAFREFNTEWQKLNQELVVFNLLCLTGQQLMPVGHG
jgi:hypothetical protein